MLTEKKKQFADYYLMCLNATESAKQAGYYNKTDKGLSLKGYQLLNDREIKEYISKSLKEKEEKAIAKSNEILIFLTDCLRGTITETNYYVLRSGEGRSFDEEIVEQQTPIKIKDRLKAAELLAKINRLMDGNVSKNNKVVINYNIPTSNILPLPEEDFDD